MIPLMTFLKKIKSFVTIAFGFHERMSIDTGYVLNKSRDLHHDMTLTRESEESSRLLTYGEASSVNGPT